MRLTTTIAYRAPWIKVVFQVVLCSLALTTLTACHDRPETQPPEQVLSKPAKQPTSVIQTIKPATLSGLNAFFDTFDYSRASLDKGVPAFILQQFPHDLNSGASLKEKKNAFFLGLLPMVLLVNQEIASERDELLDILKHYQDDRNISLEERGRLKELSKRYNLRGKPLIDHRMRTSLLKRIDTLPPSLVLAQAANESAWGTSRFARKGNNLFGQWTFTPGTGIVPEGRPPGETYEVARYSSLYQSLRSYMRNLNTHGAYLELRDIRASIRKQGKPVTGEALAGGLSRYSSRGQAYIDEIQDMIRQNQLNTFNLASLRDQNGHQDAETPYADGLFASQARLNQQRISPPRLNP